MNKQLLSSITKTVGALALMLATNNATQAQCIIDNKSLYNSTIGVRTVIGQSFTPACSYGLSKIEIVTAGSTSIYETAIINVFAGETVTGTSLGADTIGYTPSGVQTFVFDTPINLTAGQQYTFVIDAPSYIEPQMVYNDPTTAFGSSYFRFDYTSSFDSLFSLACKIVMCSTTTSTTNDTICSAMLPYTWNGLTFNGVGSQTATLVNVGGCDSLATLNIVAINPTPTASFNDTVCSNTLPYIWNGNNYYGSGTYQSYISAGGNGCDTSATLYLVVKLARNTYNELTVCSNVLPYMWNGLTFTKDTTLTATLVNALGCDSLATLKLIVSMQTLTTPMASSTTICAGDTVLLTTSGNGGTGFGDTLFTENFNANLVGWTATNVITGGSPDDWTLHQNNYYDTAYYNTKFITPDSSGFYMSDNAQMYNGSIPQSTTETHTTLMSPMFSTKGWKNMIIALSHAIDTDGGEGALQMATDTSNWTTIRNYYYSGRYTYSGITTTLAARNNYLAIPSQFEDKDSVYIRFKYDANYEYIWAINNLEITGDNTKLTNNYNWTPNASLSTPTNNSTMAMPTASTTYIVTADNGHGCVLTDSVMVNVTPLSIVIAPPTGVLDTLCVTDSSRTLVFGGIAGTYSGAGVVNGNTFNPSIAGVGTHTITHTEKVGCTTNLQMVDLYVDACLVGLSKLNNATVKILPNPNNGTFSISTPIAGTYVIVNELGQTLQTIVTNANSITQVSGLASGVYVLKSINNTTVVNQKIIITQ